MLEVFDKKQTEWSGLWYHPEYGGFTSSAINLAKLKLFKGTVRLYVKKNRLFNGGKNGRPNYLFSIKDANSTTCTELGVIDDEENRAPTKDKDTGIYYTEDGDRLYTRDEVQFAIDRAAEDGARGYGPGENIVSDYL